MSNNEKLELLRLMGRSATMAMDARIGDGFKQVTFWRDEGDGELVIKESELEEAYSMALSEVGSLGGEVALPGWELIVQLAQAVMNVYDPDLAALAINAARYTDSCRALLSELGD